LLGRSKGMINMTLAEIYDIPEIKLNLAESTFIYLNIKSGSIGRF
jgi:hypothetical protein